MDCLGDNIDLTMLVDDNDVDRYLGQQVLKQANFSKRVQVFSSGTEALRYLQEHEDKPEDLPGVIFLDMYMPDADAFFFIRRFENLIRLIKDKCKLVILSSFDNKDALKKIIQNKYVIDVMSKPMNKQLLLALKTGNQYSAAVMMKRS